MAEMGTISSKGQLVIPAKLRAELGWKPGARVIFRRHGNGLRIEPASLEAIIALRGKYAGMGLEEELIRARRDDEVKAERKMEVLREDLRP